MLDRTSTVWAQGPDECADEENGILLRLLIGRMPGPLFVDELQRTEAYALTHGTVAAAA